MMYQVKIFNDTPKKMEAEVNKWFEENGSSLQVINMSQAADVCEPEKTVLTFLYKKIPTNN